MNQELKSKKWEDAVSQMRSCHLSLLDPEKAKTADWKEAFNTLVKAIKEERSFNPAFAPEFCDLDRDTEDTYGFYDIMEEYFDFLEEKGDWEDVIASAEEMISLFKWEKKIPSEYMYRKGNALEKSHRLEEAEDFGEYWLSHYPQDLYAAAANVYIKAELGKLKEAEDITKKYLRQDLVCDNDSDTFFMAASRLFELTDNIDAKQRIEKKVLEYHNLQTR
ncbi:MAG: hypothetical protein K6F31_01885 [Acetatifactor sp.]|nr:hypothetical protein [Acetatifactor sp.]